MASLRDFTQAEADARRQAYEALFPNAKDSDSRFKPLYDAYGQATDPATGELDFDRLNEIQNAYLTEHPELRADWEKQQFVPLTSDPMEQALKAGQKLVNEPVTIGGEPLSYYGMDDRIWGSFSSALGVQEKYPDLQSYRSAIERTARQYGLQPDDLLAKDPVYQKYTDVRSAIRRVLITANPDIGVALSVWYGVNLPDTKLDPQTRAEIIRRSAALYESLGIQPP